VKRVDTLLRTTGKSSVTNDPEKPVLNGRHSSNGPSVEHLNYFNYFHFKSLLFLSDSR